VRRISLMLAVASVALSACAKPITWVPLDGRTDAASATQFHRDDYECRSGSLRASSGGGSTYIQADSCPPGTPGCHFNQGYVAGAAAGDDIAQAMAQKNLYISCMRGRGYAPQEEVARAASVPPEGPDYFKEGMTDGQRARDRYECRKEAHELAGEQGLSAVPLSVVAAYMSPGAVDFVGQHGWRPSDEEHMRLACMHARGYKFMMPNETN